MSPKALTTTKRALEELLEVEMSAVSAYGTAIRRAGDAAAAVPLVELKKEHHVALGIVRNELAKLHDRAPIHEAGAVGTVVRLVQRTATLFGIGVSLRSLRAGEATLRSYLATLADMPAVLPEVRHLLVDKLVPGAEARTRTLELMMDARRSA